MIIELMVRNETWRCRARSAIQVRARGEEVAMPSGKEGRAGRGGAEGGGLGWAVRKEVGWDGRCGRRGEAPFESGWRTMEMVIRAGAALLCTKNPHQLTSTITASGESTYFT